jgi:hypothetical protein
MGRINARLFDTAQCAKCQRYVSACSGRPVLPVFVATIAAQLVGALVVMILACVGLTVGGRIELWFGIPFAVLFGLSLAWVFWIARSHR